MLKRVHFPASLLPYLLVAPQVIITLIFFIWPASQAVYQSFLIEDAFGFSTEFVWFENFELLVEGTAEETALSWKQVKLEVQEQALDWSATAPLVYSA